MLGSPPPAVSASGVTPLVKLVFTASAPGTAEVELVAAGEGSAYVYEADVCKSIERLEFAVPTGDDAKIVTEIEKSYAAFDFNRDEVEDVLDLAFAQRYYRASEAEGGSDWVLITERGIDVNSDAVVDAADFILIIEYLYEF
jgi:hypothetical protein